MIKILKKSAIIQIFFISFPILYLLTSCNGSLTINGSISTNSSFSIGGVVSGLAVGETVTIVNNGSDTKSVTRTGTDPVSFTFSKNLSSGDSYNIAITSNPAGKTCIANGNTGSVSQSNISVQITCSLSTAPSGTTAGVTLLPYISNTSESGTSVYLYYVLNSVPTNPVTLNFTSSNTLEGTVSPSSLSFSNVCPGSTCWYIPQAIMVTGVDDSIQDGSIGYQVQISTTSADTNYNGLTTPQASLTNVDNDTAGVYVSSSSLLVSESGMSATFTVVLTAAPSSSVTIPVSTSNSAEGLVSGATLSPSLTVPASSGTLTFTTANWNVPQSVTVTGIDDSIVDGNIVFQINLGPASSIIGSFYNGLVIPPVSVTNIDNDQAKITVSASGPTVLYTTEGGGSSSFSVVLNSQPSANVTLSVTSSNTAEGLVSGPTFSNVPTGTLIFTTANWNTPQTVSINGQDDLVADGNINYTINFGVPAGDAAYTSLGAPASVNVSNLDNDQPKVTVSSINPTTLMTTESAGSASFSVVLNSQPTANVTILVSSSNSAEGLVSGPAFTNVASGTLTFTTANWNSPQTVTITGQDDFVADGNVTYSINFGVPSGDAAYTALGAPASLSVINTDNDTPGISVNTGSGLFTSEAGTATSFQVVLNSQPTANVIIGNGVLISSSNVAEISVTSGTTLTFTSAGAGGCSGGGNWCVPQTVTLTGVDDALVDGIQNVTISWGTISSTDPVYNNFPLATLTAYNMDNETNPKIVFLTPTTVTTNESGSIAKIGVMLGSELSCPSVTLGPITSLDLTEGTVTPTSLTFTNTNWFKPQYIYIQGVPDGIVDGNIVYNVNFGTTSGCTDAAWNGVTPNPAQATVTNNDYTVATYMVSHPVGTFSSINYSTPVPFVMLDDDFVNIPIGFTFNYFGVNYTTIDVGTNGLASFDYGWAYSLGNSSLFNFVSQPFLVLAPWWDDLLTNGPPSYTGRVWYLLSGTTPNRTLTIEWNGVYMFADYTQQFTFQIILYETSNVIDFVYGPSVPGSATASASVGISDGGLSYRDGITGLDTGYVVGVNDARKQSEFPPLNTVIRFTP